MPTQLLSSMSQRAKITVGASIAVFLIAMFLMMKLVSAPTYQTVAAGMDPADIGTATAALDTKGVAYEIRSGGTEIAVESASVSDARIALAEGGISGGVVKQPGFELLDKQKLGTSSFQQQVAYQRALEGSIAQTIGAIDGVRGAQVRLTLPKDELFADETKPATAAVLLDGDAAELDPGQVRGIANLVASSVPDLDSKKVTITDQAGQLVWPQGEGTALGADGTGGLGKPAAEARYAQQLESSLDAMLVRTLGPNKAHVQVVADLDVSEQTEEKLTYARRGTPLTETTETESLESEGGGAGGAAGAAGNIPSYAAGAAGGGESNYERRRTERDLGVDKTVTRRKVAPGAVQRLDVAVVVDKSVPAADVAQLRAALTSAAGVRADRGDTLAVSQVAFAEVPTAEDAPPAGGALPVPPGAMGAIKGAAIALGALLFLFFVTRHLRRREADPFADEPSWLRALPAGRDDGSQAETLALPVPMEEINFSPPEEALSIFNNDPRAMALEELVEREPERVAQQLRTWITEDK